MSVRGLVRQAVYGIYRAAFRAYILLEPKAESRRVADAGTVRRVYLDAEGRVAEVFTEPKVYDKKGLPDGVWWTHTTYTTADGTEVEPMAQPDPATMRERAESLVRYYREGKLTALPPEPDEYAKRVEPWPRDGVRP